MAFEVGSYLGFSTLHIAKALKENGSGRLVAFDINTKRASETIRESELIRYVEFIQGDSNVALNQYLLDHNCEIDFIFIDGDHTCRGCISDFNAVCEHIKEGGYVIFHDIYPQRFGWKGPRLVLDFLKGVKRKPSFVQFDIEEIADIDASGIAICRKISSGKNPLLEVPFVKKLSLLLKMSRMYWFYERIFVEIKNAPNLKMFFLKIVNLFWKKVLPQKTK